MTVNENPAGGDQAPLQEQMRGARYAEILLVTNNERGLVGAVYNSYGLNDVPQDLWQALDAKEVARQHGAHQVSLNGPRSMVMDKISLANPGVDVVDFGGIGMRQVATIQIAPGSLRDGRNERPYVENSVARTTVYVFEAGKDVYELTAPDGARYVMQSSSQAIDPSLTVADLPNLGSRLKLPDGWSFQVRQPETDWTLRVNGEAKVVQDDLENTYQRAEE